MRSWWPLSGDIIEAELAELCGRGRDTLPPAAAAPRAGDSGLQPGLRVLQLQITRSKYIIMGGWSHAAPRTYCKNSVFVCSRIIHGY